jgi:hypothetical protein
MRSPSRTFALTDCNCNIWTFSQPFANNPDISHTFRDFTTLQIKIDGVAKGIYNAANVSDLVMAIPATCEISDNLECVLECMLVR